MAKQEEILAHLWFKTMVTRTSKAEGEHPRQLFEKPSSGYESVLLVMGTAGAR